MYFNCYDIVTSPPPPPPPPPPQMCKINIIVPLYFVIDPIYGIFMTLFLSAIFGPYFKKILKSIKYWVTSCAPQLIL